MLLFGDIATDAADAADSAESSPLAAAPSNERFSVGELVACTVKKVNVANRILSILHEGTILSVASLSHDQAKMVELKISPYSKAVGIPLSDLNLPKDLLIAVIESQGRVMVGKGNRVLCPDDIAIAICHPHQIPKLQQIFQ